MAMCDELVRAQPDPKGILLKIIEATREHVAWWRRLGLDEVQELHLRQVEGELHNLLAPSQIGVNPNESPRSQEVPKRSSPLASSDRGRRDGRAAITA